MYELHHVYAQTCFCCCTPQTEHGDIFKVSLDVGEVAAQDGAAAAEEAVRDVRMLYFDTVPPTVSMCILKTGFLFCASEFGNHYLFQIAGVGTLLLLVYQPVRPVLTL